MSDHSGSASKIILVTLVLAIAVLSYFLFSRDNHRPIELSEAANSSFVEGNTHQKHATELSGSDTARPETKYPSAEATELDLTLLGVVASSDVTEASATIKSRLQVRTYFIDDQIAYTNAIILEINNDRVVLDNKGEIEVLLLQGTKTTSTDPTIDTENRPTQNQDQSIVKSIGNRPKALEHIIHLAPNPTNNDNIVGFAVAPGLNPKLFQAARFQPGDVLQKVNGIDVTTEDGLKQIQQLIPHALSLVFSVSRGGRTISLYLDIPSEGLQLKNH